MTALPTSQSQKLRSALDGELDAFIASFESAMIRNPDVDFCDFLPAQDHEHYDDVVCELIRVDLEMAWTRGEMRYVEWYKSRATSLFGDEVRLKEVLREEARLRTLHGDSIDEDEYLKRFGVTPFDKDLPKTSVLTDLPDHTVLPSKGDVVAGFELMFELGRGAFGRVFYAKQIDLAERAVALKISSKFPGEWQTLARLQHPNIVPVYSLHRQGQWHIACMPYRGSTTLADLIRIFHSSGTCPASGKEVVSTLKNLADSTVGQKLEGESSQKAHQRLELPPAVSSYYEDTTFMEWVLWLGVEIADGLCHAHERGILHRDIKPANILLADDGLPMLLDFNLADDQGEINRVASVGGTPRYMAPEHLRQVENERTSPDARSDVYSLGLVLFELLTGSLPFKEGPQTMSTLRANRAQPALVLSDFRTDAKPGVCAILRIALATDPALRYQSVADLRDDLRRQLEHQKLKVAPNDSLPEGLSKWRKRHPILTSWLTVTSLAVVLVLAVTTAFLLRHRQYQIIEAQNGLHRLSDTRNEVRALMSDRAGPKAKYAEVRHKCRVALESWTGHQGWLNAFEDKQASEICAEFRHFEQLAELQLLNPAISAEQREKARKLTESMQSLPLSALVNESRLSAINILPTLRAQARSEAGRWEYWQRLAHYEHRAGDLPSAKSHFQLAADLNSDSPWPLYDLGLVALDANDYRQAETAFTNCLKRKNDIPECYFNRALARIGAKDFPSAIADLDHIEPAAAQLPRLYFVRELAKRRIGDLRGADKDRAAGLKLEPVDAIGWNSRGEARLATKDSKGAASDFRQAIEVDPDLRDSYLNLSNVLSESLGLNDDSVKVLDGALHRFPDFTLARAGRAVLLARLGRIADAIRDAEEIVKGEPTALVLYQAACVFALTAKTEDDRKRCLATLRASLKQNVDWAASMKVDPDLNAVWKSDMFLQLIRSAETLSGTTKSTSK